LYKAMLATKGPVLGAIAVLALFATSMFWTMTPKNAMSLLEGATSTYKDVDTKFAEIATKFAASEQEKRELSEQLKSAQNELVEMREKVTPVVQPPANTTGSQKCFDDECVAEMVQQRRLCDDQCEKDLKIVNLLHK